MESQPEPGSLERIDRRIFLYLYTRSRNRVFERLMPFMSQIANRGFIQIVAGVPMLFMGDEMRRAALAMFASAGAAGFFAELTIKLVWKRPRPFMVIEGVRPKVPSRRLWKRPSFPSGHAAGYFASAVALSICFPALAPIFIIIAAAGGFSRIYCGVHFLSDVLAGAAIGIVFALIIAPHVLRALG